jgi:Ca-activated chloride channel family protein
MSELFARLESPVLGDIAVQWPGVVTEVFPERIPDLYLGEPLVMVVKASQLTGAVHFSGMRARAHWQQSVTLSGGAAQGGIARLFARRKIDAVNLEQGHLRRELGREQARAQVRSKIVELGLAYHLVTRHTSLVAVEKERSIPAGEKVKPWPVPVNLPAGWEMEAIWGEDPDDASSTAKTSLPLKVAAVPADKGRKQKDQLRKLAPTSQDALLVALNQRLPQTATSASLLLLAGLLLLGVALLLRRRGRA